VSHPLGISIGDRVVVNLNFPDPLNRREGTVILEPHVDDNGEVECADYEVEVGDGHFYSLSRSDITLS